MEELVVDTKGQCFLCLNPIEFWPVEIESDLQSESEHSIHSLQHLARYLRMNLNKILIDEGSVPPGLLAKVQNAQLKAELCEGCASLNQSFSNLYKSLELIEMEITSCTRRIHSKLLEANESGKEKKFNNETVNEPISSHGIKGKLDIVEVLRTEAMQKCFKLINSKPLRPTVNIQKLSMEQVNDERIKIKFGHGQVSESAPISSTDTIIEDTPKPHHHPIRLEMLPPSSYIKVESSVLPPDENNKSCCSNNVSDDAMNFDLPSSPHLEDSQSMKHDTDPNNPGAGHDLSTNDQHETIDGEVKAVIPTQVAALPLRRTVKKANSFSKKKAGKLFKCKQCKMEFASHTGREVHIRSIHLQAKFICSECGKEFSQSSHYHRHYRNAHQGLRYKCEECNKTFTQQYNLDVHNETVHLGKRFSCKFCSQTFARPGHRNMHMRRKCPKRKDVV